MIQQEIARSGQPVLRFDSRLLASSIDPIREAMSWAVKVTGVRTKGSICVIGAGCGYHLVELQKQIPGRRIVVIERSREVADWVTTSFPSFENMEFIVGENPSENLERWCDGLFGVGQVLLHGPTAQIHPDWTRAIHNFVLARDRTSFLTQIRARPELLAILNPLRIEEMTDEPVSIKTLQSLFQASHGDSQERRLWRVLEELIA